VNPHFESFLETSEKTELVALAHNAQFTWVSHYLNECLPPEYYAHTADSIQIWEKVNFRILAVIVRNRLDSDKIIARIELTSAANKSGDGTRTAYLNKRANELSNGIVIVELDYTHELPSLFPSLLAYPSDPNSQPYHIAVIEPGPSFEQGKVDIYSFGVDEPIPTITIPLFASNNAIFDLRKVYNRSYGGHWFGRFVDYAQLPLRFETYSAADQARIRQRMALIAEAHARGEDLEAN
jgi:hypothetical protein